MSGDAADSTLEEQGDESVELSAQRLVRLLAEWPGCLVAYSGGVDSAVVAKAAHLALGDRAVAVTGASPSLAEGELDAARRIASAIGVDHRVVETDELSNPAYVANAPNRCFHCKDELYGRLEGLARQWNLRMIADGANADDLGDFRPGMTAARQHGVRSPLAELGFGKSRVRELAVHWRLEVWDKPATPCLSSRVAYGVDVTPERLKRIDAAERLLRELGFGTVRVRCHEHELARLEVPLSELPRLCEPSTREHVARELQTLGFAYVTLDLEGFRSGSFAAMVPADALQVYARPK